MSKISIYQLLPRLFGNQIKNPIPNGSIEQNGCGKFNDIDRSYFTDGGYAGIKSDYKTRVFKCVTNKHENIITEYKVIGNFLTVNLPPQMGTLQEEKLIGRENSIDKLNNIIGVTYNAQQVKKRIKFLKDNGLLGQF